jgi:hypothetical protein
VVNASIKARGAMKTARMIRGLCGVLALTLVPAAGWAQERVGLGVATTVLGPVTVARVDASPAPLKFKDDVFLNDRIQTGDKGFARMLLGGKAIVTAREHSVIVITETPGVSTIDLVSGRLSVAVDKAKMQPGQIVEIKTPNAIAGIRGTIVVAEALNNISTITVLRGLVDVYRRDPMTGSPVGPATPVGVRESVSVRANVLPARPQTISAAVAARLSNDFTAPTVRPVAPTSTVPVADEVTRAQTLLGIGPVGSTTDTATRPGPGTSKTVVMPMPTTLATVPTLGTTPLVTAPLTTVPLTTSGLPTTSIVPTTTVTTTLPITTNVPILPSNGLLQRPK